MIDMVNNRYIASFLGITPVTLSRLRHGVATRRAAKSGQTKNKEIIILICSSAHRTVRIRYGR